MNNSPRVSVVIPFLNPGRFLAEAVESVLAQTFSDWEIILVNDGSSDHSESIARRFVEGYPERVSYYHHGARRNYGTAASRNLAASKAQGEFLAFLDADDVWLPDTLRQQVSLLDRYGDAEVVYGTTQYWHSWTGVPADVSRDEIPDLGLEPEVVFPPRTLAPINYPLGDGPAPSMNTVCLRRSAFYRIGGFEEAFTGPHRMYEDQAFLIKLYMECRLLVSAECWDRYRQHADSICARVTKMGYYDSVRLYFLRWCREYLRNGRLSDPLVEDALEKAFQRYGNIDGGSSTGSTNLELRRSTGGIAAASWRQQVLGEGHAREILARENTALRNVTFANDLILLGGLIKHTIGGGLKLELVWKSVATQVLSGFVAIHCVDMTGAIQGQADYPQDQGVSTVSAGTLWRDVRAIPASHLRHAAALAIGVYERDGTLLAAAGAPGDWDGHRVWLSLE